MKIEINRLDDAFHFEATNENGRSVQVDAAPAVGGHNAGLRPMQLLLVAIGTCSLIDILLILKKQRQEVQDVKMTVTGDRDMDAVPSPFVAIQMNFTFFGELKAEKVAQAVRLGVEQYCSVGAMLEKTAKVTYSFDIQPFTTQA